MFVTCREIQQILVKLGDKEPGFIGSNKWIGAIELGFILDEYLGVGHKVRAGPGLGFNTLLKAMAVL